MKGELNPKLCFGYELFLVTKLGLVNTARRVSGASYPVFGIQGTERGDPNG